jgi:hypothetical protein
MRCTLKELFSAKLNPEPVFAEFARCEINFENNETDCPP